jgi:hypothetical protein
MMKHLRIPILSLIAALVAGPVFAQTYTATPSPFQLAQDNSGKIINNACVWTYVAGSTTAATTYSTATGTANTNPIRSDSAGRFTAFLAAGNSYKYVYESACTPPSHGTVLKTVDGIAAVPASGVNVDVAGTAGETLLAGAVVYLSDGSGGTVAGQWYNATSANAYSSNAATMVGIAPSAVASGAASTFRISGRVTGLTGLIVGSVHYVGASAGTLTATAPANARAVGAADTATTLDLAPNPRAIGNPAVAQGRLTLTTGTPITSGDVSGATSIYYTPFLGNQIALYDGTVWITRTFTEITVSLAATTASTPYDIFVYDSAGTVTAEKVAWTNTTTRATALTTQNGVYVKSGTTTKRYVGTVFINASGGQSDDTAAKRYVYNAANGVPRAIGVTDATNSWAYSTATLRQANASTANQIAVMQGLAERPIDVRLVAHMSNSGGTVPAIGAIGEDSTSAAATGSLIGWTTTGSAATIGQVVAALSKVPAVGLHTYAWLEYAAATGTTTWYGDNGGVLLQSGMVGMWWD